jgi:hypothetical protein
MIARFLEWGIHMKWVTLFPHVDDFNGRELGQNFLGAVSRTVENGNYVDRGRVFIRKQRQTMTFCQCKVHEDANVREVCAMKIHSGLHQWKSSLPRECRECKALHVA